MSLYTILKRLMGLHPIVLPIEQIGFSNLGVGLADELKHLLDVISVSLDSSYALSVCGQIIDIIVIHFHFLHFLIAYII